MYQSKQLFVILFFLVSLILNACCDDQRNDIPGKQCELVPDEYYFYSLGESKDYMYFKEGTWWVYKNTVTNEIDTISVYQAKLDTVIIKGSEGYSYQRIYTCESASVRNRSKKYPYQYDWYSRVKNPDASGSPPSPLIEKVLWEKIRSQGYTTQCFVTPSKLHSRTDIDLVIKDTSLIVAGKYYTNVQVFKIERSNAYFDILDTEPFNSEHYSLLYYAKHYGLIMQIKYNSKIAIELLDCKIIQ